MVESLLSLVVPVYNASVYLPRCLESLLAQTYQNLEIICVDDGSTDESAKILEEYAKIDSRIRVILKENAGVSAARNSGLDVASGEYVSFVDADDWVENDAYEEILNCFSVGIDFVWFDAQVEGIISEEKLRHIENFLHLKYNGKERMTPGHFHGADSCVWNKVFKREVIERHHCRFPQGILYGEDAAFCYCVAAEAQDVFFLQKRLYHYMQHEDSAMGKESVVKARSADQLHAVRYVNQFYQRAGLFPHAKVYIKEFFDMSYGIAMRGIVKNQVSIREYAYELAKELGILTNKKSWAIRDILNNRLGIAQRIFHRYVDNRETYGVGKYALFSISYGKNSKVYRVCGFFVKEETYGECE